MSPPPCVRRPSYWRPPASPPASPACAPPRHACPPNGRFGPPPPRRQLSFNYLPDGRRVNTQGGTYWIPACEYDWVVARARYAPEILNAYRFEPLPAATPASPPCSHVPPAARRR